MSPTQENMEEEWLHRYMLLTLIDSVAAKPCHAVL